MNRNIYNLRASSTHAGNQNSRWRTVLLALVFALASSGAAQPPPPSSLIKVYMDVVNPKTTVCVGETVQYSVKVLMAAEALVGGDWALPEVEITGRSSNEIIGHFTRDTARTGPDDGDVAKAASFSFMGGKPGKIILTFTASVLAGFEGERSSERDVSFPVPVKVIYCKYKITTITKFPATPFDDSVPHPAIVVRMKETLVTADADGGFNGSGASAMLWVGSSMTGKVEGASCTITDKFAAASQVNLSGNLSESGNELRLTLTFGPQTGSQTIKCTIPYAGTHSYTGKTVYALDPLKVGVPAGGGMLVKSHGYNSFQVTGVVIIIVTPVKDSK